MIMMMIMLMMMTVMMAIMVLITIRRNIHITTPFGCVEEKQFLETRLEVLFVVIGNYPS